MEKFINQIRLERDRYGINYWNYRISGNVMELVVEHPYQLDRRSYRSAVIKIGMALKALSWMLDKSAQAYLIQSFPALENLRIVAAIRIQKDDIKPESSLSKPINGKAKELSAFDIISQYASKFNLQFEEINRTDLPEDVKPKVFQDKKWHILCSNHDNPFTWINIGYCQEAVYDLYKNEVVANQPVIISEGPIVMDDKKPVKQNYKKYIQSIIALNT